VTTQEILTEESIFEELALGVLPLVGVRTGVGQSVPWIKGTLAFLTVCRTLGTAGLKGISFVICLQEWSTQIILDHQ